MEIGEPVRKHDVVPHEHEVPAPREPAPERSPEPGRQTEKEKEKETVEVRLRTLSPASFETHLRANANHIRELI